MSLTGNRQPGGSLLLGGAVEARGVPWGHARGQRSGSTRGATPGSGTPPPRGRRQVCVGHGAGSIFDDAVAIAQAAGHASDQVSIQRS